MIAKIAWRNIWFRPLQTTLSLLLLTASVTIISVLILIQEQFERQFTNTIEGVDMVLGAPGSPLQLILSSVYHIDAPTGNISLKEAEPWMKHPFVKKAIPMAFGDNYRGYKILGTTHDYLEKYNVELATGQWYRDHFEVVVGSEIAKQLNLKIGDTFHGAHGDSEEGHVHEEFDYKVVGISKSTKSVVDYLIFTTIESVWAVHENHDQEMHEDASNHEEADKEITAVLIQFKNKMGILSWGRMISQNTKMMAALPGIEINRLFSLFGLGIDVLRYLSLGIMGISGVSIFITLYYNLKDRKYEFALMRISGARRLQLLWVVLLESIFLCVVGLLLGFLLSRLGLWYLSVFAADSYRLSIDLTEVLWDKEGLLILITIFVGLFAAVLPAIKAYRLNLSKTLADA